MDFVVTLNGGTYTVSTSDPAVLAAISGLRQRYNQNIGLVALATDGEYVQKAFADWAVRNEGFTQGDFDAKVTDTLASWVNQFNAAEFVTPELTGDALKVALKAYAAQKRYQVETGGITLNGMHVATDRQTQAILSSTVQAYQLGLLAGTIDWKASNGWVALDQATVTAIASAVLSHVQTAFSHERAVAEAIDAGTITTVVAIDGADWS